MAEPLEQLRDLIIQARWETATDQLRQRTPDEAADAMLLLPFEQQRLLFRHLPVDLAATLAGHFPYFHAYVLLYSMTTPEIAAIVAAMSSADREEFLDALPEESWQSLMKTLEKAPLRHCAVRTRCSGDVQRTCDCTAARGSRTYNPGSSDLKGIPATGRQRDSSRRANRFVSRAEHNPRASWSVGIR